MDINCTESIQNQSDGPLSSDVTIHSCSTDPVAVADSANECIVSASPKAVEITEQNTMCDVDRMVQIRSAVERYSEKISDVEKPAGRLEIDHICDKKTDSSADLRDSQATDYVVNDTTEASQSQAGVQEHWRPSNPFLDAVDSIADAVDNVAQMSVSSSSLLQTVTPADLNDRVTDSLPLSASAPSDGLIGYSRLHESAPSSIYSASPYESPTHAASGEGAADPTTDVAGSRPDSLYLSRSILQQRERQWLAKKGSYSSLSECDSSPGGSVDALIEVATSTPLHSQGTVSVEGDMITFVADGINELIKRSRGGKKQWFSVKKILLCVLQCKCSWRLLSVLLWIIIKNNNKLCGRPPQCAPAP